LSDRRDCELRGTATKRQVARQQRALGRFSVRRTRAEAATESKRCEILEEAVNVATLHSSFRTGNHPHRQPSRLARFLQFTEHPPPVLDMVAHASSAATVAAVLALALTAATTAVSTAAALSIPTAAALRAAFPPDDYVLDLTELRAKATPGGGEVRAATLATHPVLGLPDLGTAVALITLPAGAINPPHMHPRAAETMIVSAGTVEAYVIGEAGGRTVHTLSPHGVALLPRALLHGQRCVSEDVDCEFFAVLNAADPGVMAAAPRLCDAPLADVADAFGVDRATAQAVCVHV